MLASLAHGEGHRDHAQDHGTSRHQHGTEARDASIKGGSCRIIAFHEPLAAKADHQNTVGRGDPHAHDSTG